MNNQQLITQLETLIKNTQTTINNYKQELESKEIKLKDFMEQLTQIKNQTNIK